MSTGEITVPGFHHDLMSTNPILFVTSPAYKLLEEDLRRHGLEFCHSNRPTSVSRLDGRSLVLTTDRNQNAAAFNALSEGDGDQHIQDMQSIESHAAFISVLLSSQLRSMPFLQTVLREIRQRGLHGFLTWVGSGLGTSRGWLEQNYGSDIIQSLWAPWILHTGQTPESAYSELMNKLLAFTMEQSGAYMVKGGIYNLAIALQSLFLERGGTIRTSVEVDRIILKNNCARGAITSDGQQFDANKSVICSVTPTQLYARLLRDNRTNKTTKLVQEFRYGRGSFQLHYALDAPPDWIAPGLEQAAVVSLSEGIDAVSKSCNEGIRGMLPQTPTISVIQPHLLDPSRCPEGKAILWLQVQDAPTLIKGDAAGEIQTPPHWTDELREEFADRLESILALHIRDFRSLILGRTAYSPADLEAININLVGGDPYAGDCAIDQFFVWRPTAAWSIGKTAFSKLYHIGASTHPGQDYQEPPDIF